jgi:hypothetical protein
MQWITTLDGYNIQHCVWPGLAHLHIHLYKDAELEMLPYALLTDTGRDSFVECKNDESRGVKPYDPNDMVSGLLYVHSVLTMPRFVLKCLVGRSLKILIF